MTPRTIHIGSNKLKTNKFKAKTYKKTYLSTRLTKRNATKLLLQSRQKYSDWLAQSHKWPKQNVMDWHYLGVMTNDNKSNSDVNEGRHKQNAL